MKQICILFILLSLLLTGCLAAVDSDNSTSDTSKSIIDETVGVTEEETADGTTDAQEYGGPYIIQPDGLVIGGYSVWGWSFSDHLKMKEEFRAWVDSRPDESLIFDWETFERERAAWKELNLQNYDYTFVTEQNGIRTLPGPYQWHNVFVRDGKTENPLEGIPVGIDYLFESIRYDAVRYKNAASEGSWGKYQMVVKYHPTLHYPTSYFHFTCYPYKSDYITGEETLLEEVSLKDVDTDHNGSFLVTALEESFSKKW